MVGLAEMMLVEQKHLEIKDDDMTGSIASKSLDFILTALRLYFLFVGKGREKQIIISNDLLALARSYADQLKSI